VVQDFEIIQRMELIFGNSFVATTHTHTRLDLIYFVGWVGCSVFRFHELLVSQ